VLWLHRTFFLKPLLKKIEYFRQVYCNNTILSILAAGRKVSRSHGLGYKAMQVVDGLNAYSSVTYDNAATTRPLVIMNTN
jgi:hypothetical protein